MSAAAGFAIGPPVGLGFEIVRELTLDDLTVPDGKAHSRVSLSNIKHQHHALAQKFALGLALPSISMQTGYSIGYLSALSRDPTFCELVTYYGSQAEMVSVDVGERMRALGLAAMEELQGRIDAEPAGFAKSELRDLIEAMLVKPMMAVAKAQAQAGAERPNVALTVNFVPSGKSGDLPIVEGEIIPPEQELR